MSRDTVEATAPVGSPRAKRIPGGEAGLWVLIMGDMVVFAVLFAVYLNQRRQNPDLFARSQDALNRGAGAVNTMVLLCSSLLVVWAVHALRTEGQRHLAWRLLLAGFGVGSLFVVIKAYEYYESVSAGVTPNTNEFYMYFFVLTGLHLVHVLLGLAVLLALTWLARRPTPTPTQITLIEGGACLWHMVDLLWLVIFPLVFLVR